MLSITRVTKDYGRGRRSRRANDDITLEVAAGEIVGLLGHNGAGKTTLINQVAGLTVPTSGAIRVDGRDPVAEPERARRAVALMPQANAPLSGVTPRQAIETLARIRGLAKRAARTRTAELIDALDIGEWADVRGDRLSGGVRRLTAYGMAACGPGRIVMLDEPTNDVDPVRRRLLWADIRRLAADGRAVLLVTHNVAEAEDTVDRLAVLHHGKVLAQGTPPELCAAAAARGGGSGSGAPVRLEDAYISLASDPAADGRNADDADITENTENTEEGHDRASLAA